MISPESAGLTPCRKIGPRFLQQELNHPAKGSPVRKDSPGRGRWHESAERGAAGREAD